MGGPTQPKAPQPGETTREAIESEIELGPQLAASRSQAELDILQRFGVDLGQAQRAAQIAANPELAAVESGLGGTIAGRLEESDQGLIDQFTRQFRAEEAAAGRLGAPVGSLNIARNTIGAREGIQQQRINEALAFSGKLPSGTTPSTAQSQGLFGSQFLGGQLGLAGQNFGTQAGIFNAQQAARSQVTSSLIGATGTVLGAAASPRPTG